MSLSSNRQRKDSSASARSFDRSSTNLFVFRGVPEHIRSDNGPEFTAKAVRKWLNQMEVKTIYIEPGSPWENVTLNPLTARCETNY